MLDLREKKRKRKLLMLLSIYLSLMHKFVRIKKQKLSDFYLRYLYILILCYWTQYFKKYEI